jgi:hypothetical protein
MTTYEKDVDWTTGRGICGQCGTESDLSYVQRCTSGDLRYTESFRCASCGQATEAYGDELAPQARELFLASSGTWRVVLVDVRDQLLPVTRILVEMFAMPRDRALHLARSAGAELARGTRVEAEHWARRIGALGAELRIERTETVPGRTPPHGDS